MKQARPTAPTTRMDFGRYVVTHELGAGATARVYAARHMDLGRAVAIKVLHPHIASKARAVERFLREGRALARVSHPHVLEVLDVVLEDSSPYLVMELVEGETLASIVRSGVPLEVSQLVTLMLPVLSAVAHAHDVGVIHRDLKPSNILISYDRFGDMVPKVADFGISKLLTSQEEQSLTNDGAVLGTVPYMAPEQLRSASSADTLADQYSLGVILYECTTGRLPFAGASSYELMEAVIRAPVTSPSRVRAGIPPGFEAIILRAMNRTSRDRFESVRALGKALLDYAPESVVAKWSREFGQNHVQSQARHAGRERETQDTHCSTQSGATSLAVPVPASSFVTGTRTIGERLRKRTGLMTLAFVLVLGAASGVIWTRRISGPDGPAVGSLPPTSVTQQAAQAPSSSSAALSVESGELIRVDLLPVRSSSTPPKDQPRRPKTKKPRTTVVEAGNSSESHQDIVNGAPILD